MHSKQSLVATEKQEIAACRDHLIRMQQLYMTCKAIQDLEGDGRKGENLHAAKYYVAEAEYEISTYGDATTDEAK